MQNKNCCNKILNQWDKNLINEIDKRQIFPYNRRIRK